MLLALSDWNWPEIAEKLGIPFAIIMMMFSGAAGILWWLGKYVIRPMVDAHISMMLTTEKATSSNAASISKLADIEEKKSATIEKVVDGQLHLIKAAEDHSEKLDGVLEAVREQPKAIVKLLKTKPSDNGDSHTEA